MKRYSGKGTEPKLSNRIRIARFISRSGSTSKTEIASCLNLSMPTTLQNVRELTEAGLVEEEGEYESTGGRRAKALSIRRDAGYAVGVDLTSNHITMVMANARKEIMASERVRTPFEDSTSYYECLSEQVSGFISRAGVEREKIAGVGFSLPGIVDRDQKLLLYSHVLRVRNVTFRQAGDRLGVPYDVINDASSAAFAELGSIVQKERTGNWEEENQNAVYLSLSNTVGGAICYGGRMYEGENFKSAEFGHMVIAKDGKRCYCGKKGCMDAYCSALVLQNDAGSSLEEFFDRVRQGEDSARKVWDRYLDDLAVSVTNLRMIFDCRIVLGGYVGGYLDEFMPDLSRKIMKYNNYDVDTSYLYTGRYKYNASAYGAALLFTDSILTKYLPGAII